jgi:hypothetical protein
MIRIAITAAAFDAIADGLDVILKLSRSGPGGLRAPGVTSSRERPSPPPS